MNGNKIYSNWCVFHLFYLFSHTTTTTYNLFHTYINNLFLWCELLLIHIRQKSTLYLLLSVVWYLLKQHFLITLLRCYHTCEDILSYTYVQLLNGNHNIFIIAINLPSHVAFCVFYCLHFWRGIQDWKFTDSQK